VYKFICKTITDKSQITDESFFDGLFSSMITSASFMLMDYEYKYQEKLSSTNLKILVMMDDELST